MGLDLVREHRRVEDRLGALQLRAGEVTDADVTDLPRVVELVECGERRFGVVGPGRPVDVQEVDDVETEPVATRLERLDDVVVREVVVPDLRRDEDVLPGYLTDREVYFVQASEILRLQGRIEVPAGYGPALTAETGEATLNKWRTNLHRGDGRTARCNATTKIHVRAGRARHRQCRRIPHRCNALEHGKPDGRLPGERRGWIGC